MKALILFSSRDGQTRAIASYIANNLKGTLECDVVNILSAHEVDLDKYDKVMIGASVRYGHFHPALEKFIRQHLALLQQKPSAFFSVNLTARKPEKTLAANQRVYPQVSAALSLAARFGGCVCWGVALSPLSLVRPCHDSTDYAHDGR
ncbi:hypothetical protein OS21_23110 [Dickeya oryzae]